MFTARCSLKSLHHLIPLVFDAVDLYQCCCCSIHNWECVTVQSVPVNKLHEVGYVSIGCEPCTRAVLPNQHEREGRWWWEVCPSPPPTF